MAYRTGLPWEEERDVDRTLGFVAGNLLGDEEMVAGDEEVVEGVEEMVDGVRDTEDRAEDAVEEVLLTLVW